MAAAAAKVIQVGIKTVFSRLTIMRNTPNSLKIIHETLRNIFMPHAWAVVMSLWRYKASYWGLMPFVCHFPFSLSDSPVTPLSHLTLSRLRWCINYGPNSDVCRTRTRRQFGFYMDKTRIALIHLFFMGKSFFKVPIKIKRSREI